jgi:hypothetical protein
MPMGNPSSDSGMVERPGEITANCRARNPETRLAVTRPSWPISRPAIQVALQSNKGLLTLIKVFNGCWLNLAGTKHIGSMSP